MERWTEFYRGNRKEVSVSVKGCIENFQGTAKIYHPKKNETGIIIRIPVHDQESAEYFLDKFNEVKSKEGGKIEVWTPQRIKNIYKIRN